MTSNRDDPVDRRSSQGSGSSSASSSIVGAIESSLRHQETVMSSAGDRDSPLRCFFKALGRRKPLDCRTDTDLNRCLNLVDLTALGVGSTLGLGLYVLAGQVASAKAGPAVVISFALAALASAFSALCYAEFAGRVPRAGSAYAYSYITVGEFVAFIIGWNLVLEYVIGTSSVARAFSGYLRFVVEHMMHIVAGSKVQVAAPLGPFDGSHANATTMATVGLMSEAAGIRAEDESLAGSIASYLIRYFDWPSVVIVFLITVFVLFGVKESTNMTLAFTSINILVVVVVVISSLRVLDFHNWSLTKEEVPKGFGEGGFLPYGWSGVLAGSATCFFGFIGFDTIASSAEEAKNPRRNVPLSILLSLFISFLVYMALAIVQTLLWPYYDQNNVTILPYIFDRLNMPVTYWIVLVGAIAGLSSSQLGGLYPLPRILYSMAQDRLIYGYLAHVDSRLKLPVRATIVGSISVATLACLLDIQDLADMVSIGTLAAYSLVSLSVMILRYEDRSDAVDDSTILNSHLDFTDIFATSEHKTSTELGYKLQDTKLSTNEHHHKTKLAAKPSTPIREKGSRAICPQLSVGFHSWFRTTEEESSARSAGQPASRRPVDNEYIEPGYLDLITPSRSAHRKKLGKPSVESSRKSKVLIALIVSLTILLDLLLLVFTRLGDSTQKYSIGNRFSAISLGTALIGAQIILFIAIATLMLMLSRLPCSRELNRAANMFQVPLVPLVPTLSIFVNTFLMLNLSFLTWVRFSVWMTIGLFIYFTYGLWNSEGYLLHLNR